MSDGRFDTSIQCPLCGEWFSPLQKKAGYVIDCSSERERMVIRVCLKCDVVYDALEELKWEK
jgi:hypothetical protein